MSPFPALPMRSMSFAIAAAAFVSLAACAPTRTEPVPVEPVVQDGSAMSEDGGIGAMGRDDAATQSMPVPASQTDEGNGVELPAEDAVEVRVDAGADAMVEQRVVRIVADNWSFSPNAISLRKGQVVTLMIEGKAGTHGFMVPDLGINVTVNAGETVSVQIPTDATGSFSFLCSIPCGPGHKEMTGQIVINER